MVSKLLYQHRKNQFKDLVLLMLHEAVRHKQKMEYDEQNKK